MRAVVVSVCLLSLLVCIGTGPAQAAHQEDSKIALHIKSHTIKQITVCTSWSPNTDGTPCSQYLTEGDLDTAYDLYLVVTEFVSGIESGADTGIAGLSCGIQYNAAPSAGVDVFGWTLCGDLDFPNAGPNGVWPNAGGGNRITWERFGNCQADVIPGFEGEGGHAIAGAFYVYAYGEDTFEITNNENLGSGPELQITDCQNKQADIDLAAAGFVNFGGTETGCNPCLGPCGSASPCSVEPTFLKLTALPGEQAQGDYTITNQGTETLTGDVQLGVCSAAFSIAAGGGPFSLEPGEEHTVTVQFPSQECGRDSCIVTNGENCDDVLVVGVAEGLFCEVSTDQLDFGELVPGETADLSVTYTNAGCETIYEVWQLNRLTKLCGEFEIVSGGTPSGLTDSLLVGESRTVTVRFSPTGLGAQTCFLETRGHRCDDVFLTGTGVPLEVGLDIKPGSCPNPFNPVSKGVVPVAIVGTPDFDVSTIDVSSIRLEGVRPKKSGIEDVTRPFDGELCDCDESKKDGIDDLTLKFRTRALANALAPFTDDEDRVLSLTGNLLDGTPILAQDCILVRANTMGGGPDHTEIPDVVPPEEIIIVNGSRPTAPMQKVIYTLPDDASVRLTVFSVTGRMVRELVSEAKASGEYTVEWDASRQPSGVYFYRLEAGSATKTSKLLLVR